MSKRLQNRLRLQARVIEELFRRHGLAVHVDGGVVGSHVTSYRLRVQDEFGWERLPLPELTEDLVESLGVPDVRIRREFGQAEVEVGHGPSTGAGLLDLLEQVSLSPLVGLLGTASGRPLLLNLASAETAHMLVVGGPGAGKSGLLRSLAVSLALHSRQAQLQMVCFLPPGGERGGGSPLRTLAYLPHLMTSLVTDMDDIREVLAFLVAEIDYRRQAGVRLPHIVVLFDDVSCLYDARSEELASSLLRLLNEGGPAGIHLLATSGPPATARQKRLLQADWPVRVVGRLAPELAAEIGMPDAGRLAGQGGFLVHSQGAELRFQAAALDDFDLQLCLDELQQSRRPAKKANGAPFSRNGDEVVFAAR